MSEKLFPDSAFAAISRGTAALALAPLSSMTAAAADCLAREVLDEMVGAGGGGTQHGTLDTCGE
jgi:hypothetical protein